MDESRALAAEPSFNTTDVWDKFNEEDKRTLLAFLLKSDLGTSTRPAIISLLQVHMSHCAVELVVRTYKAPERTAQLFVKLVARMNNLEDTESVP